MQEDNLLIKLAKKCLDDIRENKQAPSDSDLRNICMIIWDTRIGLLDIDINAFLHEMGWADQKGILHTIPTGDLKKDEIINRLTDLLKGII